MKIWIATYVDQGETCDGKARVLDVCKSKEEAEACVKNDIERWADEYAGGCVTVDFNKLRAWHNDYDNSCEWNIEEVEVEWLKV